MSLSITSFKGLLFALALLIHSFALLSSAIEIDPQVPLEKPTLAQTSDNSNVYHSQTRDSSRVLFETTPLSPSATPTEPSTFLPATSNILRDLHNALATMQDQYFSIWLGKWTTAIDWTAAVMNTYVSATLWSLSESIPYTIPGTFDKGKKLDVEAQMSENEINRYFAQSSAFYYAEDAFAIRMQAYDDILWVVLEWLESIQFISKHSKSHYALETMKNGWHARQFIPAFAHRARVFYELAEKGWDWRLCGGGLTWNPRLLPYKNAITNELFISASVSMYLNFPGDDNCSPLLAANASTSQDDLDSDCGADNPNRGRYDVTFLANAKNGYNWLKNSGMINSQGLFTDGFHISGYAENNSKTTCDERNEMVYTYNQGVLLSGLRGLWEATNNITYLEDGHELVRNVIRATGWKNKRATFAENQETLDAKWNGLGSGGILMEACDAAATCNQDGQTFKGIFFHHLTAFCTPLPRQPVKPGKTYGASHNTAALHRRSCHSYAEWVMHNAQAALETRDEDGKFGMWWGAGQAALLHEQTSPEKKRVVPSDLPLNAVDYRNFPALVSQLDISPHISPSADHPDVLAWSVLHSRNHDAVEDVLSSASGDANDRGRGRTVETQGGGMSVVRAMLEFVRRSEGMENEL